MTYDVIIVGAGITAATVCAETKRSKRVLVLDVRPHLGGNCHDYPSSGGFVHSHDPHLFHSTSPKTTQYLERFTEWMPRKHFVTAEFERDGRILQAPFPYSRATEKIVGELTEEQLVETFFRAYSEKMWGRPWDSLPASTRGRVSTVFADESNYFPGQFVAMPRDGYTAMMSRMFEGVELLLGVDPDYWYEAAALSPRATIIYTGRPDQIYLAEHLGPRRAAISEPSLSLGWRHLKIEFSIAPPFSPTAVTNYCHRHVPYTRKAHYGLLTGSSTLQVVSTETPVCADSYDIPYYVDPTPEHLATYNRLKAMIAAEYPNLILAGRLGSYKYIDMAQAVAQGRNVAEKLMERTS